MFAERLQKLAFGGTLAINPEPQPDPTEIRPDRHEKAPTMISWNDLKNLDVKDIDLTKIDLTRFDVRKFDLPKFDMPKMDLPKVDLPKVDLPKMDLPKFELPELPVDADRMIDLARDAAYAGVGVAVVTVQKLDAQRRELTDQVTAQVRKVVGSVV